jgi:hypothetical protein
LLQSN